MDQLLKGFTVQPNLARIFLYGPLYTSVAFARATRRLLLFPTGDVKGIDDLLQSASHTSYVGFIPMVLLLFHFFFH